MSGELSWALTFFITRFMTGHLGATFFFNNEQDRAFLEFPAAITKASVEAHAPVFFSSRYTYVSSLNCSRGLASPTRSMRRPPKET